MKEFLRKRERGELASQRVGSKMRRHLQECYCTPQHEDGNIHFGDYIMLQCGKTGGFLSCDLDDVLGAGRFGVSTASSPAPILRNCFKIVKPQAHSNKFDDKYYKENGQDHLLHYNEKFQLVNANLHPDMNLMLHSTLVNPSCNSRVTKKQEVSLVPPSSNHDTCWQVLPADIRKRAPCEGTAVKANQVLVINHCATNQHLWSDNKLTKNSFGMENEVCAFRETGQHTRHNMQETEECNIWAMVTAPTGAHYEEMFDAAFKDTASSLARVKEKLLARAGDGGYRSLVRILKIMDDDGNRNLTKEELVEGLRTYQIWLEDHEANALMRTHDRDGSGTISITEFLRALRGEMNARRKEIVLQAHKCLDKNRDGTVNMTDMIAIYGGNLDRHPEITSGIKTKEKVLLEFTAMWDKDGDATVTPEEFIDYYTDLSVNIDDDDYFVLMVRNAWHISGGDGVTENTTCRRVLVTHMDGSQSVEEIKNDLGIRPNDLEAMTQNLMDQGIMDIKRIQTTG